MSCWSIVLHFAVIVFTHPSPLFWKFAKNVVFNFQGPIPWSAEKKKRVQGAADRLTQKEDDLPNKELCSPSLKDLQSIWLQESNNGQQLKAEHQTSRALLGGNGHWPALNKLFSTPSLTTIDFLDQVNGGGHSPCSPCYCTVVCTSMVPLKVTFQFWSCFTTIYLGLWNVFE